MYNILRIVSGRKRFSFYKSAINFVTFIDISVIMIYNNYIDFSNSLATVLFADNTTRFATGYSYTHLTVMFND